MAYGHGGYAGYHPSNGIQMVTGTAGQGYIAEPRPSSQLSPGKDGLQDPALAVDTLNVAIAAQTATVFGTPWTAGQYVGKICLVVTGANAGKAAFITANTTNTVSFGAYGAHMNGGVNGDEIRLLEPSDIRPVLTSFSPDNPGANFEVSDRDGRTGAIVDTTVFQNTAMGATAVPHNCYIYGSPGGALLYDVATPGSNSFQGFYARDFDISLNA